MKLHYTVFLLLLGAGAAFAADTDANLVVKPTTRHTGEYFGRSNGDHFEWTTYQHDYSRTNYGHRFEWTKTGMSRMSVCKEVDSETGGDRFRELAEEARCPKYETAYRWYVPYEGETSRCEEFDVATGGQRFSRISENVSCVKPSVTYVWVKKFEGSRPACQEVDTATGGSLYRRIASADYLCEKTLNVQLAYGRKLPYLPSRSPASVAQPRGEHPEIDPRFREDPEERLHQR